MEFMFGLNCDWDIEHGVDIAINDWRIVEFKHSLWRRQHL